jgi:hypothetical protein
MKMVALYDIHDNLPALDAVLFQSTELSFQATPSSDTNSSTHALQDFLGKYDLAG